jgi:hypothetical protein
MKDCAGRSGLIFTFASTRGGRDYLEIKSVRLGPDHQVVGVEAIPITIAIAIAIATVKAIAIAKSISEAIAIAKSISEAIA